MKKKGEGLKGLADGMVTISLSHLSRETVLRVYNGLTAEPSRERPSLYLLRWFSKEYFLKTYYMPSPAKH